jgi:uncharacterized protein
MPVKKSAVKRTVTRAKKPAPPPPPMMEESTMPNCCLHKISCVDACKKIFITLIGIILIYFIVLLGTMIRNNLQEFNYIGQADRAERTIVVSAEGKVVAKPDIAVTTMGMIAEADTVGDAQEKNTAVMNSLNAKLKKLGIAEEDLQTANYNIYPQYNYTPDEGRILTGYQVSQNLKIKIRNLEIANKVLALAGEVGVNSVSGLDFIIDDKEVYKNQARQDAIEKIIEKTSVLSQTLGVQIISVASYNEYESGSKDFEPYRSYAEFGGLGGVAPVIESGSTDVNMNVSVTFEIR